MNTSSIVAPIAAVLLWMALVMGLVSAGHSAPRPEMSKIPSAVIKVESCYAYCRRLAQQFGAGSAQVRACYRACDGR